MTGSRWWWREVGEEAEGEEVEAAAAADGWLETRKMTRAGSGQVTASTAAAVGVTALEG